MDTRLLDELEQMTPEERMQIANILIGAYRAGLEKNNPVSVEYMAPTAMRNQNGSVMNAEEKWDFEHPINLRPYGFRETFQAYGSKPVVKVWTDAEVDAYNKPIEEAWIEEKRKIFPDAVIPPNDRINHIVVHQH